MRITSYFILVVLVAFAAGCGYSSSALLPPELDSIHVSNFENMIDPARETSDMRSNYTYWPGLENQLTRGVIDGFIFDRHLAIKPQSKAALTLSGQLTDFRQYPLSYDGGDNVVEYRVEIVVDMELYDNLNDKSMWKEDGFMGWSSYNISGPNTKSLSQAVEAAVDDLSRRIVERVVEAW